MHWANVLARINLTAKTQLILATAVKNHRAGYSVSSTTNVHISQLPGNVRYTSTNRIEEQRMRRGIPVQWLWLWVSGDVDS